MNRANDNMLARLNSWQRGAWIGGVVAALVCALGLALDREQFFRAYLFAFLYWWTLTMGCVGLGLLYQMTGGRWGMASQPFFDAGMRVVPLVALAFVPLALGLGSIYRWTEPDFFAGNPHAANRAWYLTRDFFLGRAGGYFVVCLLIVLVLTWRRRRAEGIWQIARWPKFGGLGAVVMVLVVTMAAIDWGMSLDPDWFSTLYAGLYIAGGLLMAFCLAVAGVALTIARLDRDREVSREVLHDLGKLLLAMLMVWAYFEFSQFLIIYSGNLPVEATWYVARLESGWQWVALAIVVLHFVAPFLCLLSREVKRDPRLLAWLAIALAGVHAIDLYWRIGPSLEPGGFSLPWLYVVLPVCLGGFWLGEFFRQLKHRLRPVLADWPPPEH